MARTKEEGQAVIKLLDKQIEAIKEEIEEVCIETGATYHDFDEFGNTAFFPTREAFMEYHGYREDDMEWVDQEFEFPGWVSSGAME